jgi:hypothetical protein
MGVAEMVVDTIGISAITIMQMVATMVSLTESRLPRMEKGGSLLKGVVGLVVHTEVIGVEAIAMEILVKENVPVVCTNAGVELGKGMSSNVKGLVVETGELPLMKLFRRLKSLLLKMKRPWKLKSRKERRRLLTPSRRLLRMFQRRKSLKRRRR